MIRPYKFRITHIYKPAYKGKIKHFMAFTTEADCWEQIRDDERYGMEREYTPTKKQVKADGWTVVKYKLMEA
jgi:hypothetical protein